MSCKAPSERSRRSVFGVTRTNGTGLVVWKVWGVPSVPRMVSALPWSAVMIHAPPFSSSAA